MSKLKVAFFGTPKFSISSLQALMDNENVEVTHVVTGVDKKSGRGQKLQPTLIADFATSNGLNVIKTTSINKLSDVHDELKTCDFFLVIAFSQFLSKEVLDLPKIGCFNIHTSLLPKYRGAAPVQYALLNGDTQTGVCIQKMVSKMDAGDIAIEVPVQIEDKDTSLTLFNNLQEQCPTAINLLVDGLMNNTLNYKKQDESEVSFAPTISKNDGHLNFTEDTATQIINKHRAYTPWPGTFTFINDIRIKVLEIELVKQEITPSEIDTRHNTLTIGTKENSVRLTSVQLPGKKPIKDFEFINGQKQKFDSFTITDTKD